MNEPNSLGKLAKLRTRLERQISAASLDYSAARSIEYGLVAEIIRHCAQLALIHAGAHGLVVASAILCEAGLGEEEPKHGRG